MPEALKRGPFSVEEARRAGLERWHLEGASWNRVAWGTYLWVGLPDTSMERLAAARQRLPPGAVFSGLTAAWLHGLDVNPCDPIEVTLPLHIPVYKRSGMRIRRAAIDECDVVVLSGNRATGMVRTLADACSAMNLVEAVVLVDAALHARRTTLAELSHWANARKGRRNIARLRHAIQFAEPGAESQMETRLRMVLALGGLPRPRVQASIYDAEGRFVGRPDLYYERARLGIEYDGGVHRTSLADDNRRQNRLLGAGVRLLRFTAFDVKNNSKSVVMQVRAMVDHKK